MLSDQWPHEWSVGIGEMLLDVHVPGPPLKVPPLADHEEQYAAKPDKVLVKAEL